MDAFSEPSPPAGDGADASARDVVVVGGGIVGLAVAWRLAEARPDLRLAVLEKESRLAAHQTGRNSGVVHSGIYYRPGSLKATLCRAGRLALAELAARHDLPYDRCGKVIVAVDEEEAARLPSLLERGRANGVACRPIGRDELRAREPHVAGRAAIEVQDTGIVDYAAVCARLAASLRERGHAVITGAAVTSIAGASGGQRIRTRDGRTWEARIVVTCGGLQADRVARLAGARPRVRIVPFRGEYHVLRPEAEHLCRHLIYPMPDPALPFLGVHLTRMVRGGVECGPNAVLALAREGYRHRDVSLRDLGAMAAFPGFHRLLRRHWRTGIDELRRSLSRPRLARDLRRLVPELREGDLRPAPAGVRAQAVSVDGRLVDDFVIEETAAGVHVLNAPSPAATASLAIGRLVADRADARLPPRRSAASSSITAAAAAPVTSRPASPAPASPSRRLCDRADGPASPPPDRSPPRPASTDPPTEADPNRPSSVA